LVVPRFLPQDHKVLVFEQFVFGLLLVGGLIGTVWGNVASVLVVVLVLDTADFGCELFLVELALDWIGGAYHGACHLTQTFVADHSICIDSLCALPVHYGAL
jgi:hypothetical protein